MPSMPSGSASGLPRSLRASVCRGRGHYRVAIMAIDPPRRGRIPFPRTVTHRLPLERFHAGGRPVSAERSIHVQLPPWGPAA